MIQNCAGDYAHRRRGRRSLRTVLTVVLPVVLLAVLPVFYVQILLSCTQCRHFAATSANVPQCAPQSGQYQFGMQSEKNDAFKWFIQPVCKSDYHGREGKRKRAKSGDRDQ